MDVRHGGSDNFAAYSGGLLLVYTVTVKPLVYLYSTISCTTSSSHPNQLETLDGPQPSDSRNRAPHSDTVDTPDHIDPRTPPTARTRRTRSPRGYQGQNRIENTVGRNHRTLGLRNNNPSCSQSAPVHGIRTHSVLSSPRLPYSTGCADCTAAEHDLRRSGVTDYCPLSSTPLWRPRIDPSGLPLQGY